MFLYCIANSPANIPGLTSLTDLFLTGKIPQLQRNRIFCNKNVKEIFTAEGEFER